ncbi:MAG: gliding motility-associated C-terminal domain-containing protein [bacterium]
MKNTFQLATTFLFFSSIAFAANEEVASTYASVAEPKIIITNMMPGGNASSALFHILFSNGKLVHKRGVLRAKQNSPFEGGQGGVRGIPHKRNTATANPTVWIELVNVKPFAGEKIDLSLHVGGGDAPVDNLFGLGFELHYSDGTYLVFNNPGDAQAGDFLQPDVYSFTRHEPENKIFYLAVSRKRGVQGQKGEGVALVLPVSISPDAPPGWKTCFAITNVIANDPNGGAIQIDAGPVVCLEVGEPAVEVVPNPITPNDDSYNDDVEFKRDGGIPENWVIVIMDRTGRIIRRLTNGANRWDGRNEEGLLMLPGAYLYVIRDGDRVVKRGVLGIIR